MPIGISGLRGKEKLLCRIQKRRDDAGKSQQGKNDEREDHFVQLLFAFSVFKSDMFGLLTMLRAICRFSTEGLNLHE